MKRIGFVFLLAISTIFLGFGQKSDLAFWRKSIPIYLSDTNFISLKSKLEKDTKQNFRLNQQDYYLVSATILLIHPQASKYLNEKQIDALRNYLGATNKFATSASLRAWLYAELGFSYYSDNQYVDALSPFLLAQRDLDNLKDKDLILGDESLKKIGYYYLTMRMLPKSVTFLERVVKISDSNSENHRAALFNIGVNHYNAEKYSDAKIYLDKCLELSEKNGDWSRYAKALGELGRVKWVWNQKEEALQLLKEDIKISKELGIERNMMYARIQLGKMFLENEDLDSAQATLEKAYEYAKNLENCASFQEEIAHLLMELSIKKGDVTNELYYRRLADELNKMNSFTIGKDAVHLISSTIQSIVNEWEIEERNREIAAQQKMLLRFSFIGGVVILSLSVSFLIYRDKANRIQRLRQLEIEEFKQAKQNSERKLKEAHSSLESYKVYLQEKNAQIERLTRELTEINSTLLPPQALKEKKTSIKELLNSHLMTDENWELFKAAFISERREYYHSIKQNFQDLTESNLRIILLQKLNLTNQGTAHLLGITIDAVKKAKQRMRKKYGDDYAKFEIGVD